MERSNRYFLFHQKVLSLAGIWYTQPYKERLVRYFIIGFISIYNVLGELCQILTMNLDLQTVVRTFQIFVPAFSATIIYFTSIINFMTLQKIYNCIHRDWQRIEDEAEIKIMRRLTHFCNLFTFISPVLFCLYLTISIAPSLRRIILTSNEVRSDIDHYPIISCVDYLLDRQTYYYPLVFYQITISFLFGSLSISCYTMYFCFVLHACAHLAIIKYHIYYPFMNNNQSDDTPVTQSDLSPWITDIVKRLTRITEFMNLVNSMFEKNYLLQMFFGLILLVIDFLCLFQIPILLEHKDSKKDVIELIFFVSGTLSLIYINCYIGQRLIDNSMEVYKEVCLVPIHELSFKTQKILLTTLMVSAKPCVVSIGKVYVASHEFFCSILQTALSFAMVVHSMQTV